MRVVPKIVLAFNAIDHDSFDISTGVFEANSNLAASML